MSREADVEMRSDRVQVPKAESVRLANASRCRKDEVKVDKGCCKGMKCEPS